MLSLAPFDGELQYLQSRAAGSPLTGGCSRASHFAAGNLDCRETFA